MADDLHLVQHDADVLYCVLSLLNADESACKQQVIGPP
jgi:hypothetical protein